MQLDRELLTTLLDYSRWATEQVLDACSVLSEEELERDLKTSYTSVQGTLVHLFQSDRIWLSRLSGEPRSTMSDSDESWDLPALTTAWGQVHSAYATWVSTLEDPEQQLAYHRLNGEEREQPVWQVLLHVVNHASYHRGQITTLLRQLGYTPVNTDMHLYLMTCAK